MAGAVSLVDDTWLIRYGISAESEERTAMVRLGRVAPVAGAASGGQEMTLVAVPAAQGDERAFETRMVDAAGAVRGQGTVCCRFELLPTGPGGMKPAVAPKAGKRYYVCPKPSLGQLGEGCSVTPHPDDVRRAMQRSELAPPGPQWATPGIVAEAAAPAEGAAATPADAEGGVAQEPAAGAPEGDGADGDEAEEADALTLLTAKVASMAEQLGALAAKNAELSARGQPSAAGPEEAAGPEKPVGELGEALWAAAYGDGETPGGKGAAQDPAGVYKMFGGLGGHATSGAGAAAPTVPGGYPSVPVPGGAGSLSHYGLRTGSAIRPGHRRVAGEVLDRIGSRAETVRAYVSQEYSHVSPARYGEMEVIAAMMDTAIERAARAGVPRSALLADDALEIAASRLLALDLMERDGNVSGALALQAVATDNYLASSTSREAASKVAKDEQKLQSALNSRSDKPSRGGKGRGNAGKGVVCFLCEENHAIQDCPKLAAAKAAAKK